MSTSILRRTRLVLSVVVTVVFSMMVLVGCDGNNNSTGGGGGGSGGLVLPDGWAWVYEAPGAAGIGQAYVFKANGDLMNGSNATLDGSWDLTKVGTWEGATGSSVKVTLIGAPQVELPYSISGETLSFMSLTFTKTNIGSSGGSGGSGSIVTGANEAWVSGPAGYRTAVIVTATHITFYEEDEDWDFEGPYPYTLSGTQLTIALPEGPKQGIALLSNNNNTLTLIESDEDDKDTTVFQRMPNPVGSGGGGGLINCQIGGICTPGVFTAAQCIAASGQVVDSCVTLPDPFINCSIDGVCTSGELTATQCIAAGGQVMTSCPAPLINCKIQEFCVPGLFTTTQCTSVSVGGTVDASCSGSSGGGNVVTAAGEAWVIKEAFGFSVGYMYEAGGRSVFIIGDEDEGIWVELESGTWSVSGNQLTLTFDDEPETVFFGVSGNKLIAVVVDGGTPYVEIYTKISGITLVDIDDLSKKTNNVRLPKALQKR